MAREHEQQQFIALLQTLGPNTPVLPLILKGIISNSSLSNKAELSMALDKMSQPDPQQTQMQQAQAQLAMQSQQAQIKQLEASATKDMADAQKTMVEAQLAPKEVEAKVIASVSKNLPQQGDQANVEFDRRVKIAELMLKEADLKNNTKIVELQMADKASIIGKAEEDFLNNLTSKLSK
jgi:multidrug efflux pump subunit AcrA (membrane-fusion protein)